MKEISIVIPAYNEAGRIESTIFTISRYLTTKGFQYEIIIIDDGSTDSTYNKVKKINNQHLLLLRHHQNFGKGAAVKTGVLAAQYQLILLTDADLSTPIEELDNFLKYTASHEIVIGSRALPESEIIIPQPAWRSLGGKLLNFFIQMTILPGFKDTQCGFKLFQKQTGQILFKELTITNFGFDIEILYLAKRYNLSVKELPVRWSHRRATRVKPLRDGLKILKDLARIKLNDLTNRYQDLDVSK